MYVYAIGLRNAQWRRVRGTIMTRKNANENENAYGGGGMRKKARKWEMTRNSKERLGEKMHKREGR